MRNRFVSIQLLVIPALGIALAISPVLFAQAKFDPHDLNGGGVWNADRAGKVACSLKATAYPPDPNCVVPNVTPTGNPKVKSDGYNILPTGVEMTKWAHDVWMSQDQGTGISGNADPEDRCDPLGFPRGLFGYIHPFEIVQTPTQTLMIYEEFHFWRLIWTDGRPVPKAADLPYGPTWLGFSVGKWQGNDFIVTTMGMNDKTWLDQRGHPHSEDMVLTEDYRRVDHDHLEVSVTVNDPKAYTKVFTFGPKPYVLKSGPDWEIQESICTIGDETSFNKQITNPAQAGILAPRK